MKKDNKGSAVIEFVITMLLFLFVFSFLVDFFFISYRRNQLEMATTNIVRQLAIQGGIGTNPPTQFPGGAKNYTSYQEMETYFNQLCEQLGVSKNSITGTLIVKRKNKEDQKIPLDSSARNYVFPFGTTITLELRCKYNWGFWLLMGATNDNQRVKQEMAVRQSSVTEYISYDKTQWEDE